ncbi:unnamed protein product [Amoebophrya sp. A25]|nr:unnamed protein product [Amoebophrya sp. A25]|eukprot:GSA25T00015883001.1
MSRAIPSNVSYFRGGKNYGCTFYERPASAPRTAPALSRPRSSRGHSAIARGAPPAGGGGKNHVVGPPRQEVKAGASTQVAKGGEQTGQGGRPASAVVYGSSSATRPWSSRSGPMVRPWSTASAPGISASRNSTGLARPTSAKVVAPPAQASIEGANFMRQPAMARPASGVSRPSSAAAHRPLSGITAEASSSRTPMGPNMVVTSTSRPGSALSRPLSGHPQVAAVFASEVTPSQLPVLATNPGFYEMEKPAPWELRGQPGRPAYAVDRQEFCSAVSVLRSTSRGNVGGVRAQTKTPSLATYGANAQLFCVPLPATERDRERQQHLVQVAGDGADTAGVEIPPPPASSSGTRALASSPGQGHQTNRSTAGVGDVRQVLVRDFDGIPQMIGHVETGSGGVVLVARTDQDQQLATYRTGAASLGSMHADHGYAMAVARRERERVLQQAQEQVDLQEAAAALQKKASVGGGLQFGASAAHTLSSTGVEKGALGLDGKMSSPGPGDAAGAGGGGCGAAHAEHLKRNLQPLSTLEEVIYDQKNDLPGYMKGRKLPTSAKSARSGSSAGSYNKFVYRNDSQPELRRPFSASRKREIAGPVGADDAEIVDVEVERPVERISEGGDRDFACSTTSMSLAGGRSRNAVGGTTSGSVERPTSAGRPTSGRPTSGRPTSGRPTSGRPTSAGSSRPGSARRPQSGKRPLSASKVAAKAGRLKTIPDEGDLEHCSDVRAPPEASRARFVGTFWAGNVLCWSSKSLRPYSGRARSASAVESTRGRGRERGTGTDVSVNLSSTTNVVDVDNLVFMESQHGKRPAHGTTSGEAEASAQPSTTITNVIEPLPGGEGGPLDVVDEADGGEHLQGAESTATSASVTPFVRKHNLAGTFNRRNLELLVKNRAAVPRRYSVKRTVEALEERERRARESAAQQGVKPLSSREMVHVVRPPVSSSTAVVVQQPQKLQHKEDLRKILEADDLTLEGDEIVFREGDVASP